MTHRGARLQQEVNSTVYKKLWRKAHLSCSYCPPNAMENCGRNNKFDCKGWKDKLKRRHQYRGA